MSINPLLLKILPIVLVEVCSWSGSRDLILYFDQAGYFLRCRTTSAIISGEVIGCLNEASGNDLLAPAVLLWLTGGAILL